MSVLRPRPPTDPIEHHPPPGVFSADGRADASWGAWLARAERVRSAVASASGSATEAMLRDYGTTGSPARRRDSTLFAILDLARRVRESVDRVVVIGDRHDRALIDLLLSTCCHPRHDDLPRDQRGGRPRIWTLGPDDDDDTVQGILDCLGTRTGDRLLDAWGLLQVGPCHAPFTRDCVGLFVEGADPTVRQGTGPVIVVAAAVDHPDHLVISVPAAWAGESIAPPSRRDGAGVFTAAALLPAAIAGIDVVRLLEGAAAMARRFREAPAEANPVVSLAIVGRWLAAHPGSRGAAARRRLLPPSRWRGLMEWQSPRTTPPAPHAPAALVEGWFTTPITVAACRRDPFATIPRGSPAGTIDRPEAGPAAEPRADHLRLPRCDEHTLGQLLEALRLASALEASLD